MLLLVCVPNLALAGSIAGRVVDSETGEPLSGATIVVDSPALAKPRHVVSGDDGFYELRDLAVGHYDLAVYFAEHTVRRKQVRVRADDTTWVAVSFRFQWTRCRFGPPPIVEADSTHVDTTVDNVLPWLPHMGTPLLVPGADVRVNGVRLGGFPMPSEFVYDSTMSLTGTSAVDSAKQPAVGGRPEFWQ